MIRWNAKRALRSALTVPRLLGLLFLGIVIVWLASGLWFVRLEHGRDVAVLASGQLRYFHDAPTDASVASAPAPWMLSTGTASRFTLKHEHSMDWGGGSAAVWIPVWWLVAGSAIAWIVSAWRARVPAGVCRSCRYPFEGLGPSACCPECGDRRDTRTVRGRAWAHDLSNALGALAVLLGAAWILSGMVGLVFVRSPRELVAVANGTVLYAFRDFVADTDLYLVEREAEFSNGPRTFWFGGSDDSLQRESDWPAVKRRTDQAKKGEEESSRLERVTYRTNLRERDPRSPCRSDTEGFERRGFQVRAASPAHWEVWTSGVEWNGRDLGARCHPPYSVVPVPILLPTALLAVTAAWLRMRGSATPKPIPHPAGEGPQNGKITPTYA